MSQALSRPTYAAVGELEAAIDRLEYLVTIPNLFVSVPLLRLILSGILSETIRVFRRWRRKAGRRGGESVDAYLRRARPSS